MTTLPGTKAALLRNAMRTALEAALHTTGDTYVQKGIAWLTDEEWRTFVEAALGAVEAAGCEIVEKPQASVPQ